MSILGVAISFLFSNNLLFHYALGTQPLHDPVKAWRPLWLWGLVTSLLLVLASLAVWSVLQFALKPLKLQVLTTLVTVSVILVLAEGYRRLRQNWSTDLPPARLVVMNTALLGGILLVVNAVTDFSAVLWVALAAAAGYLLSLALVWSLQTRWAQERLPQAFQGFPVQMISAGLIALVLAGFDTIFHLAGGS